MTYTTKAAVCSQIRTKHWRQSEHHVEFLNVKTVGSQLVGRRTAMGKERRTHHIMISKQQPKYYDETLQTTVMVQWKEWLATNPDGKLPTNQEIEGYEEEE